MTTWTSQAKPSRSSADNPFVLPGVYVHETYTAHAQDELLRARAYNQRGQNWEIRFYKNLGERPPLKSLNNIKTTVAHWLTQEEVKEAKAALAIRYPQIADHIETNTLASLHLIASEDENFPGQISNTSSTTGPKSNGHRKKRSDGHHSTAATRGAHQIQIHAQSGWTPTDR